MSEEPGRGREGAAHGPGRREHRLTEEDRRIVRDVLDDLEHTTPPSSRMALGCPVALLGLLVLVTWPGIVHAVPGGDFLSPFVLLAGVVFLVGGPVLALLGGRGGPRAAEAAVEAALRRLESHRADRETVLRASTLLLAHAFVSRGPATTHVFEPDEVASRIGNRLPVVEAVERYLIEEGVTHPVFTMAEENG